ncbi:MAG: DUF4124 domain-containing protein [Methylococcaceae bacterium]|nr:DUF4124 domain-containing protein [Methylococcaceae bacterium]
MKWLALASVLLLIQGVEAQQIYKSVDKNGKVIYSSQPASGAVKVETVAPPAAPSQQEVERAQQRYLELEARDAEREEGRREQERENLRQRQIEEDLALKRKIANRKPPKVIVVPNPYYQDPYYGGGYWGGPYPPPHRPIEPKPLPAPEPPHSNQSFAPVGGAPLYRKSGSGPNFLNDSK